MLLKAARQFEPLDVQLARDTYLEALSAALFAGRLALGGGVLEVAQAARAAPRSPQPARARLAAGRPGRADHRRLRSRGAAAQAGAERLLW
jgi:hypothetical protein